MRDDADRRRMAATFEQAAALYQRARPEYPTELYERLIAVSGIAAGARLLEIGCATGKATLPLARRGFHITCLEPGPSLAAAASENLAGFDADVVETTFEAWDAGAARFALVYAATAWHWLDPDVRYAKAAAVLEPGGHLATWSGVHVLPEGGDPFFDEIQAVYDEIGESIPPGTPVPRPQRLADDRAEIEASGCFAVVDIQQYDWETTYDAEGYIDLLRTFSGHIAMESWQRERLFGEIRRRLAARADGRVRRHWGAVLHIARRR